MAIEETLRQFVQEEIAGLYTISMVIVEDTISDHGDRRCEVSLKYNRDVIIDNVPIASPFVGDDAGAIFPVEQDDEGFVLHSRRPFSEGLTAKGHLEPSSDRRFEVEDAVLFPMIWNDDVTVPDHEPGEMLLSHTSGTLIRIKPDSSAAIEHKDGNVIQMNADGSVTLGDPSSAKPLLNEDAVIEYEGGGDNSSTMTANITDAGTSDVDGS